MQNLNILTVGAKDGKGGFFPEGIAGRINTPEGFDALSEGTEDFSGQAQVIQVSPYCLTHSCRTERPTRSKTNIVISYHVSEQDLYLCIQFPFKLDRILFDNQKVPTCV